MNARVQVKICGLTNRDDAHAAIALGADALGFNLFPGSKRHVLLQEIAPWLSSLPGHALRVAVMVDPSVDELLWARPHFDVIQLHGNESAAFCAAAARSGPIWKAVPVSPGASGSAPPEAAALLLDSAMPGAFGGTGMLADLDRAAVFVRDFAPRPVWLAGGLDAGNVAGAILKAGPFGVDVASGVEAAGDPRRKDSERIRAFIAAVRGAA